MIWKYASLLKSHFDVKIVVVGDHVTALPQETLQNCPAIDWVVLGGNYDFSIPPASHLLRTEYRGSVVRQIPHMASLPILNRKLTDYRQYAYLNGNFSETPGAYTMFARDCWHRPGCSFCAWDNLYPVYSSMTPDQAIAEVENCMSLGIKEIFDDSGTFPKGQWLSEFTEKLRRINHGPQKIRFGCNVRPKGFTFEDFKNLQSSGFRTILVGLESANEITLHHIGKGSTKSDCENTLRMANRAGLQPHLTCMVGFPWETRTDLRDSIDFIKRLFRESLLQSVQATIVIPYPGTRLFKEAKEKGWLKTEDWNDYDMSKSVLRSNFTDEELRNAIREIYSSWKSIPFLIRQFKNPIKLAKKAKYYFSHRKDFK